MSTGPGRLGRLVAADLSPHLSVSVSPAVVLTHAVHVQLSLLSPGSSSRAAECDGLPLISGFRDGSLGRCSILCICLRLEREGDGRLVDWWRVKQVSDHGLGKKIMWGHQKFIHLTLT